MTTTSQAEDIDGGNVHWAYAAYFGTGTYELGDSNKVTVLRPTSRWTYRDSELREDGSRTLGWRFRFPVAVGLHKFDFDDLDGLIDPDNVGSVSAIPGIEMDIPVTQRWMLRPSANVGWGTLTDGSESAWSYWATLRSRYTWNTGKLEWALLNSIGYVGYTPDDDKSENMFPLMAGLEFAYPFSTFKLGKDPLKLNWHIAYTNFQNDMDIVVQRQDIARVSDKWQVGLALGKQGKKIELWKFRLDRIGLTYERGGNNLSGVKIYFRSVFDI
jgi:hypothetical protein